MLENSLPEQGSPETIVGASLKVEGTLNSGGDLKIDGQVKGSIFTKGTITIGEGATIESDIQAADAIVAGTIKGNLNISGKTLLQKSAVVNGDIITDQIEIQAGAKFSGRCSSGSNDKASPTDKGESGQNKKNKGKSPELPAIKLAADGNKQKNNQTITV